MDETIMIRFKQPKIVNIESLIANNYNPNRMPQSEMDLLKECINKYGFLFPIVCTWDNEIEKYRIIDGYHRYETLKRMNQKQALIVDLQIPYTDAVQLTVLMNRIKGMHQVDKMSDLVIKLSDMGLEDNEIAENLGMEPEELIRLQQQLGIANMFKDRKFSKAWDVED